MMRKVVMTALLALWIPAATLFVGAGRPTTALAQAQKIGPEVGKPLLAAQEAIKKKRWPEAIAKIREAQAVSGKSPFEQYQINELLAYVLSKQGDDSGVARAYEENLNSGQTPPDQVLARIKTLTQLYFKLKNYGKTIEYGDRWIRSASDDPTAYLMVAQTRYLMKDYRNAARVMQSGIEAARRTGKPVQESWLLLRLRSLYELNDKTGIVDTHEQLVRSFPKTEYWQNLLDLLKSRTDDDRLTLNLYRLMLDLNVLSKPSDYIEMAQMDLDKENRLPGEALQVVQKGFDNKILDNNDRARHERVLTAAKTGVQHQQQALAQLEQNVRAAQTGDGDVYLGAVYLSYGKYDKAVEAIQRGLQKGGVKHIDDAQILLGRAYLKLGQKEEARKAFKAVAAKSPLAGIADLWAIRSQQA